MSIVFNYIFIWLATTILSMGLPSVKKKFYKRIVVIIIVFLWSSFTLFFSIDDNGDRSNYAFWYQKLYPNVYGNWNYILNQETELGWVILNIYGTRIIHSIKLLFFLYAVFPTACFFKLFTKQKIALGKLNFLYGITLTPLYVTYLCRQMYAAGFVVLAMMALYDKKYVKALLLGITSFLFHKTSVVFFLFSLIIFLIRKKKIPGYALILGIVITPIIPKIAFVIMELFKINKWSFAIDMVYNNATIKALPFFAVCVLYYIINEKESIQKYNFDMISIYLCGFFFIMTVYGYWLYRLGIYFLPTFCVAVSNLHEISLEKKDNISVQNNKYMLFLILFLMSVLTLREIYLVSQFA